MSKIKAFTSNKKKKISTKESWYVFFIVLLSVAIIFLIVMIYQGPFNSNPISNNGNKNVGTDVTIDVDTCGSFTTVLNLAGSVLPDFEIEQNCYLKVNSEAKNCKARAKVYMFDNSNKYWNIVANFTGDWQLKDDNYYYYNSVLLPSLVLKFMKSFISPSSETNLFSGNVYPIYITIETIPETFTENNIWLN